MLKAMNKVGVAGPVGVLDTIYVPAQGEAAGVAVICHPNPLQGGTHTNKVVQTAAKALSQLGYACYCPNLRGVGDSEGEHDYGNGEVDDAIAVVEYAKSQHPGLPLALAGFSFGGFVAARARARIEADKLLLMGVAVGKYPIPTPEVPVDTLVIHGEEDEVIPLSAVMDWARPQNLPVLVFPGAGHFFHGRLVQLAQMIQRCW
ncbi:alpha/beta fold hydrolase [Chromobacterium violaceum]|uniref:alpha/beta hydrolase n=1 Tax=Chromobacterium violaceum TaxID=536 RepID=UPI0009DA6EFA|nr:alpha/beta fold hydrolase [Chromobacterium violaceum]MBP4049514.1 alpha/beta fold hydrolase [Chromobacterium violaceum]OQS28801.1 alpha/beta hydrolase [Chromobacterium violaceum]